jgi:hypothetical protein
MKHIELLFAIACMFAAFPGYANCFHDPVKGIYNRFEIFESKVRRALESISTMAENINVADKIQGLESNIYTSCFFLELIFALPCIG